jgi:hypothetical protein
VDALRALSSTWDNHEVMVTEGVIEKAIEVAAMREELFKVAGVDILASISANPATHVALKVSGVM